MDASKLEHLDLFAGLSKKEIARLAQWTDEVSVPDGYKLASEGSFAHEFFVIEDGAVAVSRDGGVIAQLGPGDFFGEIGLLETERRTASVVATGPTRLIVMSEREFSSMRQDMPGVAEKIQAAIRARLGTPDSA